jgi:hypothetical protein
MAVGARNENKLLCGLQSPSLAADVNGDWENF